MQRFLGALVALSLFTTVSASAQSGQGSLNGYVKDMDFHGAFSQTVAPLPFRAMPNYPYPDSLSYPDSHREYQLEWNTREVSDEGAASYRFQYSK